MKKIFFITTLLLLAISGNVLADAANSAHVKISAIETRDSGAHAIYFSGTIPTQECTHEDRAIIVESGITGTSAFMEIALIALINQKDVVVRVEGCTLLNPNKSIYTSPKIVKLKIFN